MLSGSPYRLPGQRPAQEQVSAGDAENAQHSPAHLAEKPSDIAGPKPDKEREPVADRGDHEPNTENREGQHVKRAEEGREEALTVSGQCTRRSLSLVGSGPLNSKA